MISQSDIRNTCQRIAELYKPHKIILFGSYAYGHPAEYSDVDLLVLLPFDGESILKSLEIANQLDTEFSLDIVVRTPEDAVRRYREGDPLIREAFDRGKVLYE